MKKDKIITFRTIRKGALALQIPHEQAIEMFVADCFNKGYVPMEPEITECDITKPYYWVSAPCAWAGKKSARVIGVQKRARWDTIYFPHP